MGPLMAMVMVGCDLSSKSKSEMNIFLKRLGADYIGYNFNASLLRKLNDRVEPILSYPSIAFVSKNDDDCKNGYSLLNNKLQLSRPMVNYMTLVVGGT
jgi:hypothetical protein